MSTSILPHDANGRRLRSDNVEASRPVKLLPDTVVNQIAAGEVVERPASVVKELVENSIDAGASEITVILESGGRAAIEVRDDGCGMTRDDALLAVERFGTSKVRSIDDLQAIATHGFRGEALPSIASVSRFTLTTIDATGKGTCVRIDGGTLRDVTDRSGQCGTRVSVQNLFYNVPVRRKFLRSDATEEGLVRALLLDFALAYPGLRFRLHVDGREAAHYPPRRTLLERGKELEIGGRSPIVVTADPGARISVEALLSEPIEGLASSARLRVLVNRRSVRDRLLLRAVRDAYGNFLKPGRYPHGVISVELSPEGVDVNVHPQKTEVRFHRADDVFRAVVTAIKGAFASRAADATLRQGGASGVAWAAAERQLADYGRVEPEFFVQTPAAQIETFEAQRPLPFLADEPLAAMRYVGQLFHCYLVLEGTVQAAIIDMHAAHERAMFFRIKRDRLSGEVPSQTLLIPERVKIPPEAIGLLETACASLTRFGFALERFGDDTLVVRAVPALLGDVSVSTLFNDLLALPEWGSWNARIEDALDAAIARMACHRSIRTGRDLEEPEVFELIASLHEAETSGYCPHGRPVVTYLRRTDLELMFGRR